MCIMTTEEETTTTKPPPNLLTCEAAALASYLLEHRFQNNAVETAAFLLECTSTLPNAEAISAELMGEEPQEEASTSDLGKALTEPCTVSMTTPRGKFQVTLHEGGIECVHNKGDKLVIPADAVERMVVFPKPQDCRKTTDNGDMVLLCFSEQHAVEFQKKPLKQVCFQLPDTTTDKSSWLQQLCSSVSLDEKTQVAVVPHPKRPKKNGYSFRSHDEGNTSTTTGGMPFVQCYHGVKDGVLYPMEDGLLFFKPPMFLPRSSLTSIACGRGTGGSRYVDMTLTLEEEGGELEFTNIHRDELAGLNAYIHSTLIPAMQRDADGSSNGREVEDTTQDDSAEKSSESNDSKEDDNSTTALGKRKRTERKASREAREATRAQLERRQESDSDDDDGWEVGHGNDDEDESDGDSDAAENDNDGGNVEEEFFEEEDEPAVNQDGNVEEEFFEEDSGTATESDD